jgi:REP element-mobilizing transposase RayT
VHVTIKLRRELGSLRTKAKARVIRLAIVQALAKGSRIVDWSIQGDHIHFIAEPGSSAALTRHMRGFGIHLARALNRLLGRKGTVFADRYHVHVLTTPREVRHARAYVLLNARRHAAQRGRAHPRGWVDEHSSWAWFDGWAKAPPGATAARAAEAQPSAVPAQTWLMRVGWRRHGLVRIDETPGPCT